MRVDEERVWTPHYDTAEWRMQSAAEVAADDMGGLTEYCEKVTNEEATCVEIERTTGHGRRTDTYRQTDAGRQKGRRVSQYRPVSRQIVVVKLTVYAAP